MSTNYAEAKALREERAAAHATAIRILGKRGPLTTEERSTFDKAMAAVDHIGNKIAALENSNGNFTSRSFSGDPKRELAFGRFLRHGKASLEQTEQRMLEQRDVLEGAPMLTHVNTYSGLGFFVPTGFANKVEQATKYYAPFLSDDVCTVMSTATGAPLPFPTSNDTSNSAVIVGEAQTVNEQDATASQVILASYKMSSGLVKASIELLQDSNFDIEKWLADLFAIRWARGLENYFTNGTGSGQPTGILTAILASGSTPIVATGSAESTGGAQTGANSIGYSDLVNLEHSVDPTYRRGAKYMFHDQTLAAIKKILDKYGRPLWTPGIAVGEPSTVNGYSYTINQSMPQIGSVSEAVTVVFGDFSKFVIRKVQDLSVLRLDEVYATSGEVGFLSFARVDSNLVAASGSTPLNTLQQHS